MWKPVEKLRLREVYQPLTVPAKAASDASDARSARTRVRQCSTENSSLLGDNGVDEHIPLLGDLQEL
jgi:hypothetical protein